MTGTATPFNLDDLFEASSGIAEAVAPPAGEFYSDLPFYPRLVACTACPCRQEAARVVPGEGPLTARIGFIGRNPGTDEDRQGALFVGKVGVEFSQWLQIMGFDRQKVLVTNIVKCRTREDRLPAMKETQICTTTWLREELLGFPFLSVMFALGDEASRLFLGVHAQSSSRLGFTPMRVQFDEQPGRVVLVMPLPHPQGVLRKPASRVAVHELLRRSADYVRAKLPEAYGRSI